ncbi:ATP-grasp domain-containing protein [Micromonospora sp. WMMD1120]|uniref:ATP-grasp domain-containing protein n=1 Tax=Micromonospora sp. WMMD1120 TaxID=3016106 RepID=UPI002416E481|nr:ATP-grasp domain-containing protein [Micromonospora sp. WMMD1120]MDG4807555.1 ATP-grasp domain-containing protein [Micromonospora sp. WMMD1120]
MPDPLPTVAVFYDAGAAGPTEIAAAAEGQCRVLFVCDYAAEEPRRQRRMIEAAGPTLDITGIDDASVAGRLRAAGAAGLVTFSEPRLATTASVAALADLPFHSPETTRRCTDKAAQRDALAAAGLDHVRHQVLAGPDELVIALDKVGLPAVIKPVTGVGSRNTTRVDTLAEGQRALTEIRDAGWSGPVIVEELLVGDPTRAGAGWGDYVSVEALVRGDEIRPVCVTGKFPLAPPFRESGVVIPSTLPPTAQAQAVKLAVAAVRALGIRHGVTHTELKLTAAGPRLIEVNARVGGYVPELLHRSTGFHLIRAALHLALGRLPEVPALDFRTVEFEYFLQPPVEAETLVGLAGLRDARAIEGVLRVDRWLDPGERIDWRDGTRSHVLVAHGSTASHAEALRVCAAIRDAVRPTYA